MIRPRRTDSLSSQYAEKQEGGRGETGRVGRTGQGGEVVLGGVERQAGQMGRKGGPGHSGQAVVLVVGVLALFLIFFFVLIDFAFMYYVRGQLQNAADAAALAGASKLEDTDDPSQIEARQEAWKFACRNAAVGRSVYLVDSGPDCDSPPSELNQANDPTKDIVVGFWDGDSLDPEGTPINAVLARTRRTAEATYNGGEVDLFFGFLILKPTMGVQRAAIASRPARAEAPIALCTDSCLLDLGEDGLIFYTSGTATEYEDPARAIAWTTLDEDQQSTSSTALRDFICERKVGGECLGEVATTNGVDAKTSRVFRGAFINPRYDRDNKVCTGGATEICGDETSDRVAEWEVIAPILDECPTGIQNETHTIRQWALITITEVAAKGNSPQGECSCNPDNGCTYERLEPADLSEELDPNITFAVRIKNIQCVDCDPVPDFLSRKVVLVF